APVARIARAPAQHVLGRKRRSRLRQQGSRALRAGDHGERVRPGAEDPHARRARRRPRRPRRRRQGQDTGETPGEAQIKLPALTPAVALPAGCGSTPPASQPPAPPPPAASSAPQASAAPDPLGSRPIPQSPVAFVPPGPVVIDGPGRSKVWLLE